MSSAQETMTISGAIGPDRLTMIEETLTKILNTPRPQVEIRFVDVESMHLGVVNVLLKQRQAARSRRGDISVIAEPNSPAQKVLASVGIIGTMRP